MIFPQLAEEANLNQLRAYLEDPNKVAEQKLDGHRILLCSPGGDYPPTALTRNGTPYTKGLPKALMEFRFPNDPNPQSFILDGELVDGVFWVFDIPQSPATDPTMPLTDRRFVLEHTFHLWAKGNPAIKLVPQARTFEEKVSLAEYALRNNFEGLIFKDASSPYRSGARTMEWTKLKFVTTADCEVLAVRDDGKESIKLGMTQRTETTGIPGHLDRVVEVGRTSLIGKEKHDTIAVGDVVEVKYLYVGANGRLYQPTLLRKRDDKRPDECLTSQMKHVNKAVLEVL